MEGWWKRTPYAHLIYLPEPNQVGSIKLEHGWHISPLITSVSSCTSSIVGHGSAIWARGIFAGFSVSPSAAQVRIWSPRILLLSSAPRGSFTPVQSPGWSGFISTLLCARRRRRACKAQPRALQTIVIPWFDSGGVWLLVRICWK